MDRARAQYPTQQAADMAGVPGRRLVSWLEEGFIIPAFITGEGPGSRRLLNFRNLMEVVVVRTLFEHGLRPGAVKKLMAALRENPWFMRMYHPASFEAGRDGLGGLFLLFPPTNPPPKTEEEWKTYQQQAMKARGPEHSGILHWSEGRAVIKYLREGAEVAVFAGHTRALVSNILAGPLEKEGTMRVLRELLENCDVFLALNLGEMERRMYEVTAE